MPHDRCIGGCSLRWARRRGWLLLVVGMSAAYHMLAVPNSWCSQRVRSLIAGAACSGLFIGTVCGWSAISNVLLMDGVFAESDAPSQSLLVIYSASVSAMSLSGTPAGLLCDRAPLLCGVAVAGACVVLGSLLIGLLPSSAGFGFLPPFVLLAVGGNTCFFAATKLCFLFPPDRRPVILATICALYDASSAVSLLFFMAYRAGFSRAVVFSAYAALGAVLFGSWACGVAGTAADVPAELERLDGGMPSAMDGEGEGAGAGVGAGAGAGGAGARNRALDVLGGVADSLSRSPSIKDLYGNPSPFFARGGVKASEDKASDDKATPLLDSPNRTPIRPRAASAPSAAVVPPPSPSPPSPPLPSTPAPPEMVVAGSAPALLDAPLLAQLASSQLGVGLCWYVLAQQRVNLYLGTARVLLAAQGDETGCNSAAGL